MSVGPEVLAGIIAGSGGLAYLLGLVAMAIVAFAFVIFSGPLNSAGSVYAVNGSALGPRYGCVSTWILLLVCVSFAGGVYAWTADIAQTLFASFGLHVWWVWHALARAAVTIVFAYRSIGFSSLVTFVYEGIALVLLAMVRVAVVTHGSSPHPPLSTAPLRPHRIALGMQGVVNAFSGFEGAATLGEESRHTTRITPAAVACSLVGAAAVYIVFTWIAHNAYPTAAALAAG